EELVEAVQRWQKLVQVTQMVLAELAGRIALRFERSRECAGFHRDTDVGARLTYRSQSGAQRNLAGDEVRTARRAACLGIVVGKQHALRSELIEVRRFA